MVIKTISVKSPEGCKPKYLEKETPITLEQAGAEMNEDAFKELKSRGRVLVKDGEVIRVNPWTREDIALQIIRYSLTIKEYNDLRGMPDNHNYKDDCCRCSHCDRYPSDW